MPTNLKTHYCGKMPQMASIYFNKKRFFSEGFELTLTDRLNPNKAKQKALVKLEIHTFQIKVGIEYCPFCGEKLEAKPHLESCDCTLCSVQKVFRGETITPSTNKEKE